MSDSSAVEVVGAPDAPLCFIHRGSRLPATTYFPTPGDLTLQAGYVVHPAGHDIPAHAHRRVERTIVGTAEVLLVLRGRCLVDIFDDARRHVASKELAEGDVMIMIAGGHGFHMLEDTVLFEVKQGPYAGPGEKERL